MFSSRWPSPSLGGQEVGIVIKDFPDEVIFKHRHEGYGVSQARKVRRITENSCRENSREKC